MRDPDRGNKILASALFAARGFHAVSMADIGTTPASSARGSTGSEEWVSTLVELRPELNDAQARSIVHACIGAIQSIVTYESGLGREEQIQILTSPAVSCLRAAPRPA